MSDDRISWLTAKYLFKIGVPQIAEFYWDIDNDYEDICPEEFAYDPTEFPLIYAAQEDVGDNFIADNPGVVGKILGTTWRTTDDLTLLDPQHYDHVALDTMGRALFTYFKNYVNE